MMGVALHEIICDQDGKPVDYRFLDVNTAFEELTGLTRERVIGKTVREVLPATEGRWIETYGRVALTGEPTRFEEYAAALGKHFEVVAYSPQKEQFVAIFVNVTQRKQAESELQKVNRALRTISDCDQALVRSTDENTLLNEICRIIKEVGGYPLACVFMAENDPGKTVRVVASAGDDEVYFSAEKVTWADVPLGQGPTGNAIRTARSCVIVDTDADPRYAPWRELAMEHGFRSSVSLPLISEGKAFGAMTICSGEPGSFDPQEMILLDELVGDLSFGITALRHEANRHATEEKLRQSEERYRALVENVSLGISWIDADYRIRAANAELGRWFQTSTHELLGQKCHTVFEGRQHVCAHCPGTEALCTGKPTVAEVEGKWDEGRRRAIRLQAFPVLSEDGKPNGFIEVIENITAQREAAQTLRTMEQQLRHAQQMEAIGQLAGGVAHDFRNQLTVIRGFAEMLSRRELVAGEGQQMLAEILKAADRSAALTSQLLAFSRKQTLEPKIVDLRDLIVEVGGIAPRVVEEDVRLTVSLGSVPCFVEIDPSQFEQTMLNLISNARDSMPGGGDLFIEAGLAGPDDDVAGRHLDATKGPYVQVTVRDTGSGMDEATRSRIFEPFFTTKPVGVGTGLGLSMVYGFVKQSSGVIEVQSEPGKGTTFRLYFPRCGDARNVQEINVSDGHAPPGHKNILLVEDEPAVRKMLRHSLREAGYNVTEAGNAREAMEIVQIAADDYDMIITDVVMPGGDGIELARKIRQVHPDMPVLFLSGYHDLDVSQRGSIPDTRNILSKPIGHAEFLTRVSETLDRGR